MHTHAIVLHTQVQKPQLKPKQKSGSTSKNTSRATSDKPVFFVIGQAEQPVKKSGKNASWLLKPRADCISRVSKYIRCVDFISTAIGESPTTVSEWAAKVEEARKCPQAPHITGVTPYMRLWSIRALLLSRMCKDGIDSLKVDSSATIRQICEMNPDMSKGLARVRYHFYHSGGAGGSASDFVRQYGGRPELISMWMCFAIDAGLHDEDFVNFDKKAWWAAAQAYYRKERVHPHPVAKP